MRTLQKQQLCSNIDPQSAEGLTEVSDCRHDSLAPQSSQGLSTARRTGKRSLHKGICVTNAIEQATSVCALGFRNQDQQRSRQKY
mmetsp:Transcript_25483/g.42692  ORF Transcript_25483/g.42692 Transcript_25483/m.42692 type:complete len:85 (+) Transcript_25483:313-567(+)